MFSARTFLCVCTVCRGLGDAANMWERLRAKCVLCVVVYKSHGQRLKKCVGLWCTYVH